MWLLLLCGCYIYILSPEIIQIIPKHIGYNYYDHTITRTTHAQNPTIDLSVMQIKGIHLGFYIDFMVIFKTCGRNEFLTPKHCNDSNNSYGENDSNKFIHLNFEEK